MADQAPDQTRTIAVIDGNSLMHRAFHAIRQPMSAPDGRATNALFGFFNMFIKLVEAFRPDGVTVDGERRTDLLVAAARDLGGGGSYQAIL